MSKKPKTKLATLKNKLETPILESSVQENELPIFNKKKGKTKSASYEKYGFNIPSVEEIMEKKKQYAKYKKKVKEVQTVIPTSPLQPRRINNITVPDPPLDCKHLTFEDLDESFLQNRVYLSNIIKGTQPSKFHKLYCNRQSLCNNNLILVSIRVVFTNEQLEHIAEKLDAEFNPETDYLFKVLIPDFCLKIFMDVHDMKITAATNYINKIVI